jgi:hypothetical protein
MYVNAAAGAVAAAARNQRKPASAAKPYLKPEAIDAAMARRPRLNANARKAPAAAGGAPKPTAPAAPAAPPEPAWQQLAEAGIQGQGSAAANRAAAAGLPAAGGAPQIDSMPMPPAGGPGGRPKPMMDALEGMNGGGLMGGGMAEAPLATDPTAGGVLGMPQGSPPSGSQNPLFSANLPPQIMQRLQALQAGRGGAGVVGGGQGAPGTGAPGAPAAGPALPDYYAVDPYQQMLGGAQPPPMRPGGRPMPQGFDRRMAY